MESKINSKYTQVENVKVHYLSAGKGETIILLHGWPTSSYLWRNIITELSDQYRVIAIDLPGFGKSDKRVEDSYSFRYYSKVLTGFLSNLDIDNFSLGVHDLGGPVGLFWMINNQDRVDRLILLNTLAYPKFSYAVKLFYLSTVLPGVRNWLSSPRGIKWSIKFGVNQKEKLTEEIIEYYQKPFQEKESRKALLKSIQRLSMKGYEEIEANLPSYENPVLILYGEKDKILPNVDKTMKKIKEDLPQAKIISYSDCGHFIQEEIPEELGSRIKEFMNVN